MNATLINLAYQPALAGFDDGPLRDLLARECAAEVNEYFFAVDGIPHLTCFVKWHAGRADEARDTAHGPRKMVHVEGTTPNSPRSERARPTVSHDARAELNAAEAAVYDRLRAWRAAQAEAAGVPAFRVLSNRQMAALARERPRDAEALTHVPGIGPARAKNYGGDLIKLLSAGSLGGVPRRVRA